MNTTAFLPLLLSSCSPLPPPALSLQFSAVPFLPVSLSVSILPHSQLSPTNPLLTLTLVLPLHLLCTVSYSLSPSSPTSFVHLCSHFSVSPEEQLLDSFVHTSAAQAPLALLPSLTRPIVLFVPSQAGPSGECSLLLQLALDMSWCPVYGFPSRCHHPRLTWTRHHHHVRNHKSVKSEHCHHYNL